MSGHSYGGFRPAARPYEVKFGEPRQQFEIFGADLRAGGFYPEARQPHGGVEAFGDSPAVGVVEIYDCVFRQRPEPAREHGRLRLKIGFHRVVVVHMVLREVEEARAVQMDAVGALLRYGVRADFHRRGLAGTVAHLVEHRVQLERVGGRAACGQTSSAEVVVYGADYAALLPRSVEDSLQHPSDARLAVRAGDPEGFQRLVGVGVKALGRGGEGFGHTLHLNPRGGKVFGAGPFGNYRHRPPVGRLLYKCVSVGREAVHGEKRRGGRDPAAVRNEALYFGVFVARYFDCFYRPGEVFRRVGGPSALVAREGERAEPVARPAEANETVQI